MPGSVPKHHPRTEYCLRMPHLALYVPISMFSTPLPYSFGSSFQTPWVIGETAYAKDDTADLQIYYVISTLTQWGLWIFMYILVEKFVSAVPPTRPRYDSFLLSDDEVRRHNKGKVAEDNFDNFSTFTLFVFRTSLLLDCRSSWLELCVSFM